MYWPLTGAFMNVSAVTLRLFLIITAYMDDLLHEDTNIFFLSITRIVFLSRIIELSNFVFTRNIADGHGFLSSFFSCPELSNYRILSSHGISRTVTDFFFTRNIATVTDFLFCHELSFSLSRIIELSNFCLP